MKGKGGLKENLGDCDFGMVMGGCVNEVGEVVFVKVMEGDSMRV